MTTTESLPVPPAELASLYEIETALPPVSNAQRAALLDRLGRTLGWDAPPTGGASGGSTAAKLGGALLLIGAVVGGSVAIHGAATDGDSGTDAPASRAWAPATPTRANQDQQLPPWFGDASRPSRPIAGRVVHAGAPIAGARVVLQSYATRAGVAEELVQLTGADGSFDFGVHRASTYDVTATSPGLGYGHVRANTQDPIRTFDALTVTLSGCDHGVSGVVRDASGGVIAGAEVRPGRGKNQDITTVGTAATTDAEGRYTLCTRRGPVVAIARADGYGGIVVKEHVDGWRTLDFDLLPAGTVVGRVVHADSGEPISGARIWLSPTEVRGRTQTLGAIASSGSDGRFTFEGIAPGRHQLWADSHPLVGYGSVAVRPAQQSQPVVLALESRGGITGTVVRDGKPVSGARIGVRISGLPRGGTVVADQHGRFTLYSTGRATVEFEVVGYAVIAPSTYEAGDLDKPITVEVATAGAIEGRVTLGGKPIAAALVSVHHGRDGRVARAETDEHGAFALRGLPAGTYTVRAHSDAHQAFVARRSQPVITLARDEVRRDVALELDGAATIVGRVVDQHDQPVAGVEVEFREPADDQCRAVTGDDGAFFCTMLAGAADYTPVVRQAPRSPVYLSPLDGGLPTVHVPRGDSSVTGVLLRVKGQRRRIAGRVVERGGGPVSDAHLRALPSSAGYSPRNAPWIGFPGDVSDGDGTFAIEVWGDRPYSIHAQAPEGGHGVVADVAPGTDDVVVVVDAPGAVSGTLEGFADRPYVFVKPVGDSEEVILAVVNGERFSVDGLAPGHYGVLATTPARAAGKLITVRAGHTTELTLPARPGASVAVTVTDFVSGAPVPGVKCVALPYLESAGVFGIGVQAEQPTDAEGRSHIDAPAGRVEVGCIGERPHHADGVARVTAATGDTTAVEVPLLTNVPKMLRKGIGATMLFGHREPSGFLHTIAELRPGGTAEAAGLQVGDVIVSIDGRDVTTLVEVDTVWHLYEIGERVTVTIDREGTLVRKRVTIEAK